MYCDYLSILWKQLFKIIVQQLKCLQFVKSRIWWLLVWAMILLNLMWLEASVTQITHACLVNMTHQFLQWHAILVKGNHSHVYTCHMYYVCTPCTNLCVYMLNRMHACMRACTSDVYACMYTLLCNFTNSLYSVLTITSFTLN